MVYFNLRFLLAVRGMNKLQLSRETGIRYNTILAYTDNTIKRMNKDDVFKICNVLECKLDELMMIKND